MRYNDKPAVRKYIREYKKLNGTKQGLKSSISAMEPMHGLSEQEQQKFKRWLSPEDRQHLRVAERYYRKLARKIHY